MSKQWFQMKETAAGTGRLLLTWYVYKFLGEAPVRLIAFFVSFFTYCFAKEQRNCVRDFQNILCEYRHDESLRFSHIKGFRTFYNYANSLVDKMIVHSGNFKPERINFAEEETENKIIDYLRAKHGVFFIMTHVGCSEVIRSLIYSGKYNISPRVNIFMESAQCEVFNSFINRISMKDLRVETFGIEDIDVSTAGMMEERLHDGELLFMAGDRISKRSQGKVACIELFGRTVKLPSGVFRFAYLMNAPIFFISAVKIGDEYKIYAEEFEKRSEEKSETLAEMAKSYGKFLEKCSVKFPYQFFNFYDVFESEL